MNFFQDCEKVTYQHCQMHLVHRRLVVVFVQQISLEYLNIEHFYWTAFSKVGDSDHCTQHSTARMLAVNVSMYSMHSFSPSQP